MSPDSSQRAAQMRLHQELLERAQLEAFGFLAQEVPESWLRSFPQELLAEGLGPEQERPVVLEKGSQVLAMRLSSERFGRRALVIAPIDELSLAKESGRDALTAAAYLRAHLDSADERSDLFLFLVTPPAGGRASLRTERAHM